MEEQSNEALWYVVHTYSGYENKVANDLQTIVENVVRSQEIKVFTRTMRQLICQMDAWDGLTMEDIRRMEDEAKSKLDEMINQGEKKDM